MSGTYQEPSQEEIDNFFDFGHAASNGELDAQMLPLSSASDLDSAWTEGNINHPSGGLTTTLDGFPLQPEDFYTATLPKYYKPAVCCRYCAALNMECKVFTNDGNKSCFACISLFRTCSFVDDQRHEGGRVDTLHTVTEDASVEQGTLTSIRPFYAAGASIDQIRTELDRLGRNKATEIQNARFSKPVVRILKSWLQENDDHPYPTNEQKEDLCSKTGLSGIQVSNWLANARRRGKVHTKRNPSPAPLAPSQPLDMPSSNTSSGYTMADHLTPFERWQESPPEAEAPVAVLARAAATTEFEEPIASSSASHSVRDHRISSGSELSVFRAPSSTSLDTGKSSESRGSSWSKGSSRGSHASYNSFAKKDRRRKRRSTPLSSKKSATPQRQSSGKVTAVNVARPFQCTFCVDTFKTKYDWLRHEKSLHLNLEKWICCPDGPIWQCGTSGVTICNYCREINPSADHIESHDHSVCAEKGLTSRSFTRKDHLRQHLRLVHDVGMTEAMEKWKSVPSVVRSRCGFCNAQFTTWDDRATHLAKHFREGKTMADWTGDWGFEPEVAAHVADAMLPSLINSARDGSTHVHDDAPQQQLRNDQTFTASRCKVMQAKLTDFVQQCCQRGETVTDQMLQDHARQCLHDTDDSWMRTMADDPRWLAFFKARVGLANSVFMASEQRALQAQQQDLPCLAADPVLRSASGFASQSTAPLAPQASTADFASFLSSQDTAMSADQMMSSADPGLQSAYESSFQSGFMSAAEMNPVDFNNSFCSIRSLTTPVDAPSTSAADFDLGNFPMDDMMWSMDGC